MKTKTSILAALIAMAGSASLMAQTVYSLNVVGYINKSIPAGFSMVGCQLKASPDNKLATILPAPPEGTTVYKWTGTGYQIDSFVEGVWEGDTGGNMTLGLGEGAWIQTATAFTNTFVGEVNGATNDIPNGFTIRSSPVPQSGSLDSLGYVPDDGDTIYQWNNGYVVNSYVEGAWEGDGGGSAPQVVVGESFWVYNDPNVGSATNRKWSRTFSVN